MSVNVTREYAIVQAIIALIVADGVVEDRVYECRGEALTQGRLPAVDVMPFDTQPNKPR